MQPCLTDCMRIGPILRTAVVMSESAINPPTAKGVIRTEVKSKLKGMHLAVIASESEKVGGLLKSLPFWNEKKSVSIYLSMPREVQTRGILEQLFANGKQVFIPKIVGPNSADMRMFPLASLEEADSFPLTKWKIPEPPLEIVMAREDGAVTGNIDLVVAPGCAFDADCNRLGHGKGYYDCFLERCFAACDARGAPRPVTVGVCLDEQIVESIPASAHDVPLDYVVSASTLYRNPRALRES